MKCSLTSNSTDQTEDIARSIGSRLKGREVIELVSDLGGGKTTFTRGLAKGAGSNDRVASPTFTISKIYRASGLEIHHFDFYRLSDPGIIAHELHDIIGEKDIVTVVEWADVVSDVLPKDRLVVHLKAAGDNARQIEFTYPKNLEYLMEDMC